MLVDVILGFVIFGMAFLLGLLVTAPIGYQDENGFHYGEPDEG